MLSQIGNLSTILKILVLMVGRGRGFVWFYCSSLFSVFCESDVLCSGNVWWWGIPGKASQTWVWSFKYDGFISQLVGFNNCLKEKEDHRVIKMQVICRV